MFLSLNIRLSCALKSSCFMGHFGTTLNILLIRMALKSIIHPLYTVFFGGQFESDKLTKNPFIL